MGALREYLPERLDEWWYEHVDEMSELHKSYIAEAVTTNLCALLLAWMILGGNIALGLFGLLMAVSLRYQSLSKINNVNYATGEFKAEMKMKATMTQYLRKHNIHIRFYYIQEETKTQLKWRTSESGPRGKTYLKVAVVLGLMSAVINPGWYYQLPLREIDTYPGLVLPEDIEKVKNEPIPKPEVKE